LFRAIIIIIYAFRAVLLPRKNSHELFSSVASLSRGTAYLCDACL